MPQAIFHLATMTLREALYNRCLHVIACCLLLFCCGAFFIGHAVIFESRQLQAGLMAAGTRWLGVLGIALFCASSWARDCHDKIQPLLLALPIDRNALVWGKLAGLCVLAAVYASFCALLTGLFAPLLQSIQWALSLCLELSIIAGFSLWIVAATRHLLVSVIATIGFYLLSRSLDGIVAIASGAFFDPTSSVDQSMKWLVQAVNFVFPKLYSFASADWLIHPHIDIPLAAQFFQASVYMLLLGALTSLELQRRTHSS